MLVFSLFSGIDVCWHRLALSCACVSVCVCACAWCECVCICGGVSVCVSGSARVSVCACVCECVRVDSGFSVFPRRAPVLSHITQRRGSDSSREPTARSLPRRESAIAPARKRKARRRRCGRPEPRKERDGSPLPSRDCFCGFFFLIFTRACASLVPSIRTRSWMFNK